MEEKNFFKGLTLISFVGEKDFLKSDFLKRAQGFLLWERRGHRDFSFVGEKRSQVCGKVQGRVYTNMYMDIYYSGRALKGVSHLSADCLF